MRYRFKLFVVLYLFVFQLQAQHDSLNLKGFYQAYGENIDELSKLYGYRGVSFECPDSYDRQKEKTIFRFLSAWDHLKKKPVLAFYSMGKDTLRIWMFDSKHIEYAAIGISDDSLMQLEKKLRAYIEVDFARGVQNSKKNMPKKKKKFRGKMLDLTDPDGGSWEAVAVKLTDVLIPISLRKMLAGKGHLFIVPELNIGQIPFWLLKPYGNGGFFADSMSFSQVPHVCMFDEWIKEKISVDGLYQFQFGSALIVGNPAFSKNSHLSGLPGAESEAEEVAVLLGKPALKGKEASADFVFQSMRKAELIYFATHAFCSVNNVLDSSWIAFSPAETNLTGKINLRSIQNHKIKAKLAVLSACQTGYGKVLEGGFVGLGRAFYKAGASHTVMSLWSVSDESTKTLMTAFMRNVVQPNTFSPAEPLRLAILETKKLYPHPAQWAPFVIFGFTR